MGKNIAIVFVDDSDGCVGFTTRTSEENHKPTWMLDALPGVRMAGENSDALNELKNMKEHVLGNKHWIKGVAAIKLLGETTKFLLKPSVVLLNQ